MSRDNGVYILQSPKPGSDVVTGPKEYRVELTTCIENIDSSGTPVVGKLERGFICEAAMFGDCEVYDDANEAIAAACRKVSQFAEDDDCGGYIEYGIVVLPRNHHFPDISPSKAKQLLGWGR